MESSNKSNNNNINNEKLNIEDLITKETIHENQMIKFYELNEEGIKEYGKLKKQQLLKTVKWSLMGSACGYLLANIMDATFKRMNPSKKDIYKTVILMSSIGIFTYSGYVVSFTELKKEQNELCKLYGKEINK